jgi:suppressor of ftsI/bilirubin oxidase
MNRRQCLGLFAATFAPSLTADEVALPDACRAAAGFNLPLPGARPRVAVTAPITLRATEEREAMRYVVEHDANPTLVVASGASFAATLVNDMHEPTVTHWHGLSVDTRNDGNGETLVAPGERIDYAFPVRNRAALYWYHPHPHGATARQIHRGLFGLLEVEDDDELALRRALDLTPGATQLDLALTDRRSGDADRYAPAPEDELLGWYGCLPHVNDVLRPFHDAARRRYRLRFLNAASARTFRLAFRRDDGGALPFLLAGTDGGLLETFVACNEVLLSPAERVDVVVDFSGIASGGFVVLESRAFKPMQDLPASATDAHGHRAAPVMNDGAAFDLMQFRVRGERLPSPALPKRLSTLPTIAASGDERPLRLGFAKGRWRINDRVYDVSATPIEVPRGATETWLFRNYYTSAPHAMHLHGFLFRVLERETSPDDIAKMAVDAHGRLPTDLGMKDTVLVWPGESVRIAIDFATAASDPQVYLVHCHNLEHEDGGMMLRLRVG